MGTFRLTGADFCREAYGRKNRCRNTELCGEVTKREAVDLWRMRMLPKRNIPFITSNVRKARVILFQGICSPREERRIKEMRRV